MSLVFPIEILPQIGYKLISDIDDVIENVLIRSTKSKENKDPLTNFVKDKELCEPSVNMNDLSTSLFGIFLEEHSFFELINKDYYNHYCKADEIVNVPQFEIDFNINDLKGYIFINIEGINGTKVSYDYGSDKFEAECCVVHTPMKWNFWHFSIRWYLPKENKFWHELDESDIKKNWSKSKLAHSSKNLIKVNTFFIKPENSKILEEIYKNS